MSTPAGDPAAAVPDRADDTHDTDAVVETPADRGAADPRAILDEISAPLDAAWRRAAAGPR